MWEAFLLVVTTDCGSDADPLLRDLMPDLVSRRLANAWPGTVQFSNQKHELLKFSANPLSLTILVDTVLPSLFEKAAPLEDLSLLRGDGRPFFVTILHERVAYFKAEGSEIRQLVGAIGVRRLWESGEDQMPDERY